MKIPRPMTTKFKMARLQEWKVEVKMTKKKTWVEERERNQETHDILMQTQ